MSISLSRKSKKQTVLIVGSIVVAIVIFALFGNVYWQYLKTEVFSLDETYSLSGTLKTDSLDPGQYTLQFNGRRADHSVNTSTTFEIVASPPPTPTPQAFDATIKDATIRPNVDSFDLDDGQVVQGIQGNGGNGFYSDPTGSHRPDFYLSHSTTGTYLYWYETHDGGAAIAVVNKPFEQVTDINDLVFCNFTSLANTLGCNIAKPKLQSGRTVVLRTDKGHYFKVRYVDNYPDGIKFRYQQLDVPVYSPAPTPVSQSVTANLLINGSRTPSPVTVGTPITLSWTSTNADRCGADGPNFNEGRGASGSQQVTPRTVRTHTYFIRCINSHSGERTIWYGVSIVVNAKPGVNLFINGTTFPYPTITGIPNTISWTNDNTTDVCQASGDWSGTKDANGSEQLAPFLRVTPALVRTKQYTIRCEDSHTEISSTASVSISVVNNISGP